MLPRKQYGVLFCKKARESTRQNRKNLASCLESIFKAACPMRTYVHHIRKALNTLIHDLAEHIEKFCYDSECNFTRKRKLPPETLLSILIGRGGPLRNELLKYWNYTPELTTVPVFVQQRSKLKPLALETLCRNFVSNTVTPKLYCGYRLLAADGSDITPPVIVIADRNYEAYNTIAHIHEKVLCQ